MQNKLKPQSSNVVQQLRTANIKCVMVTGKHIIYTIKYLIGHKKFIFKKLSH